MLATKTPYAGCGLLGYIALIRRIRTRQMIVAAGRGAR